MATARPGNEKPHAEGEPAVIAIALTMALDSILEAVGRARRGGGL